MLSSKSDHVCGFLSRYMQRDVAAALKQVRLPAAEAEGLPGEVLFRGIAVRCRDQVSNPSSQLLGCVSFSMELREQISPAVVVDGPPIVRIDQIKFQQFVSLVYVGHSGRC